MIIAGVICDRCGELIYWNHASKQHIVKWARGKGYSIGKQCFCPDCRKQKMKRE